jgi:hypothetical protein
VSRVELKQRPIPAGDQIRQLDSDPPIRIYWARYKGEDYTVIVGRENIARDRDIPDRRWHVSVGGRGALPSWQAFVAIVHEVRPGVVFCLPMPPPSQWINIAEHVLHAWEIADQPLADQWRIEGQLSSDRPS